MSRRRRRDETESGTWCALPKKSHITSAPPARQSELSLCQGTSGYFFFAFFFAAFFAGAFFFAVAIVSHLFVGQGVAEAPMVRQIAM